MSEQETPVGPAFTNLPTGKPHVSFSELRDWQDCSFRHKLKHVQKLALSQPAPIMDFGTACHSACENFLKSRVMDPEVAVSALLEMWKANTAYPAYTEQSLPPFISQARELLPELPAFLETNFPKWEYVDAEHQLYEPIDSKPHAFKGFIDAIIKVKDKKGEDLFWIIDHKTTSWGWPAAKKCDPKLQQQLIFYKNFWCAKTGTDPKRVRCAFLLLKRTAKAGERCELVTVSVGPVTTGRSLKLLNNMLSSVNRGVAIKNKDSCKYCEFKGTEHCP